MAKAVLQPCKVREDRIVPKRGEDPVSYTLGEIAQKFVPVRQGETDFSYKRRVRALIRMKPGSYIGLVRDRRKGLTHFVLANRDSMSNNFRWFARTNPLFFRSIEEVYRVESMEWEGRLEVF
jgi:hypothetical protein